MGVLRNHKRKMNEMLNDFNFAVKLSVCVPGDDEYNRLVDVYDTRWRGYCVVCAKQGRLAPGLDDFKRNIQLCQ
jgi:hypothetical protein